MRQGARGSKGASTAQAGPIARDSSEVAAKPPRVLIEEWLPAAAIGVECARESTFRTPFPPNRRLHIWWARRPNVVSRAAVLGSVLPAGFPRDVFERLLGFWGPSPSIIQAQRALDHARATGVRIANPHGTRAFKRPLLDADLVAAHEAAGSLWGRNVLII